MAFLDSPILKARRLGAISPTTQRRFQLARERSQLPKECADFVKLHQSIACSTKSYTLLDANASVSALKKIHITSQQQREMLGSVRGSFNKVETNEKSGFAFEPEVVESVRERLMGNHIGVIDPQGGCVPFVATPANTTPIKISDSTESDLSEPYRIQHTESLFESDTESELSEMEMEITGVSGDSLDLPDIGFLDIETPEASSINEEEPGHLDIEIPDTRLSETEEECGSEMRHQSQKSIILSKEGMYCVDMGEGGYTLVSAVDATSPLTPPSSPSFPRPLVVDNVHEFGKFNLPKCETCSSWDAGVWLVKEREKEESGYNSDTPKLNLEIGEAKVHTIEVFASPISTRKARQRSVESLVYDIEDEVTESDDPATDSDDDVALRPFLATPQQPTSPAGELPPRRPLTKSSSNVWKKTPVRRPVLPPNYDLSKALQTTKQKGIRNLDTQLKMGNKKLVEVAPLARWKKMPVFATTTSGHRAWYKRSQDRIEAARQEAANVVKPNTKKEAVKDLAILVRAIVSRCTCKTPFQLDRVGDGKYKLPNTSQIFFVRILRNHVMVRVGGGWDTLDHFIAKHDPCRMKLKHISGGSPYSPSSSSPMSRRSICSPRPISNSPSAGNLHKSGSTHSVKSVGSPRLGSPITTPSRNKSRLPVADSGSRLPRPSPKSKLPKPAK